MLLACTTILSSPAFADEDQYTPLARGETKIVDVCGRFKFDVEAVQLRNGRFEPYVYNTRGHVEKLPCAKLVKKNKFGKEVNDAVAAMKQDQGDPSMIVVQEGKAWSGGKDDGERYRFITLWAYSKRMKSTANPCGGETVMCEVAGNTIAERWNELEHARARAAVHAGTAPAKCKAQLEIAQKKAKWIKTERAIQPKATYWKTHKLLGRDGKTVPLPEVLKRVGVWESELAAQRSGSYCADKQSE